MNGAGILLGVGVTLCVAGTSLAVETATGTGAFGRLPVTARSAALGGAVGAAETGAPAAMENPAALASFSRPLEASFDGGLIGFGRSALYAGVAIWATPELSVAISALSVGFGDDIEFRQANSSAPDRLEDANAALYTLAVAIPLLKPLDAGASVRAIRHTMGAVTALGFSGDAGMIYRPWQRITIGFTVRDVPGTSVDWSTGGSDGFDRTYVLSGAVDLNPLRIVGQWEDLGGDDGRIAAGVEWDLFPRCIVRAGTADGTLAAGLGFRVPRWYKRLDLVVDYAFAQAPFDDWTFQHRFTLTAGWDLSNWPIGRMLFQGTQEDEPRHDEPWWWVTSKRPKPLFTWPDL